MGNIRGWLTRLVFCEAHAGKFLFGDFPIGGCQHIPNFCLMTSMLFSANNGKCLVWGRIQEPVPSSSLTVGANSTCHALLLSYMARHAKETQCACVRSLTVLLYFALAVSYFPIGWMMFLFERCCRTRTVGTAVSGEEVIIWCPWVWWQLFIPSHSCSLLVFDNDNSSAGNSTKYHMIIALLFW